MAIIHLLLFAFLIQFNLSIKEDFRKNITFIERVGEPQCSKGYYRFKFKVKLGGYKESYVESIYFPLEEPKDSIFRCTIAINEEQTINCYINAFYNPLINDKIVFPKDISNEYSNLDIYDWDKIVGKSAVLGENVTCIPDYKYEFIPIKEVKAEHKCLPDGYHELKINGTFSQNKSPNNFKSTEYNDITLSIVGKKYTYEARCNITVFDEEINSNVYDSELVCTFKGDTKALIKPKVTEDIFLHDFPEYDLSCRNSSAFNKLNLLILALFFSLLL